MNFNIEMNIERNDKKVFDLIRIEFKYTQVNVTRKTGLFWKRKCVNSKSKYTV